jgi:hypothetical protein
MIHDANAVRAFLLCASLLLLLGWLGARRAEKPPSRPSPASRGVDHIRPGETERAIGQRHRADIVLAFRSWHAVRRVEPGRVTQAGPFAQLHLGTPRVVVVVLDKRTARAAEAAGTLPALLDDIQARLVAAGAVRVIIQGAHETGLPILRE